MFIRALILATWKWSRVAFERPTSPWQFRTRKANNQPIMDLEDYFTYRRIQYCKRNKGNTFDCWHRRLQGSDWPNSARLFVAPLHRTSSMSILWSLFFLLLMPVLVLLLLLLLEIPSLPQLAPGCRKRLPWWKPFFALLPGSGSAVGFCFRTVWGTLHCLRGLTSSPMQTSATEE